MEKIKFSIIVPIFNVEKYLNRCLESLLSQTYNEIEIILINDGSTDSSPQISNEYSKKYDNIKVIHKKNGGLSDSRNQGIKIAQGEYIIFVDSDDYIHPSTCERFNNILLDNPDVEVIAGNILRKDETNIRYEICTQTKLVVDGKIFLYDQLANNTIYVSACRNIYKRTFLLNNNLFFENNLLHEDEQWTPRMFLKAKRVISSDFVFYIHDIREGSITQREDKTKNVKDLLKICKELRGLYEEIEESELKVLLLNHIVTLYIQTFYTGKVFGIKKMIDVEFLKKNAITRKNKFRVKLLLLNEKSLYYYMYLRNNYISKSYIISLFKKN